MPGIYRGRIESFTVSEKQPHGLVHFRIITPFPFNGQGPDFPAGFHDFKLDETSDKGFAGMATICARMVYPFVGSAPPPNVILEVHSGSADEIDVLTIQ
jgi:hypothetical protein